MKNLLSCSITLVKGRHSILNKLGRERERAGERRDYISLFVRLYVEFRRPQQVVSFCDAINALPSVYVALKMK